MAFSAKDLLNQFSVLSIIESQTCIVSRSMIHGGFFASDRNLNLVFFSTRNRFTNFCFGIYGVKSLCRRIDKRNLLAKRKTKQL